jgi:hypothetical protein
MLRKPMLGNASSAGALFNRADHLARFVYSPPRILAPRDIPWAIVEAVLNRSKIFTPRFQIVSSEITSEPFEYSKCFRRGRSVGGSWPAVTHGLRAVTGLSARNRRPEIELPAFILSRRRNLCVPLLFLERENGCAFLKKTQIARTPYSVG